MSIFDSARNLLSSLIKPQTSTFYVNGAQPSQPMASIPPKASPLPSPTPVTAPVQAQKPIQTGPIPGFHPAGKPNQPPAPIANIIQQKSQQYNVPAPLLTAVPYHESAGTWNPQSVGPTGDFGLGQIVIANYDGKNGRPLITKEQAFDPEFAIDYLAKRLSEDNKYFGGDWNKTIAAYNTGRGGGSTKGVNPYGGGPRGQEYINNVTNNLDEDVLKQLGIKRGDAVWKDIRGYPILRK